MTNKQRVFIEEYLKCWNATEAARRAGYSGNESTLASIGSENLTKPKIKEVIEARISEMAMSADEVLIRLGEQARGDIGEFLTFYEGVKLPTIDLEKAQDKTHLIKKIKYKDGQIDFELYDAQSALVHIGKHHGLFSTSDDQPQEVVNYTIDEWRAEQARRRNQTLETIADFEDADDE